MMPQMRQASAASRVGISTISFRHRPLEEALRLIASTGATEIDLGAIPRVTDHLGIPPQASADSVVRGIARHGLRLGAINADPGDLNDPGLDEESLASTARQLARIAAAGGGALIVPAGRQDHAPFVDRDTDLALIARRLETIAAECERHGVRLLVEVLHHLRFVHTVSDADALLALSPPGTYGVLFDVSHVVASAEDPLAWARALGARIERVHLRDAVAGNLNLALGTGDVDVSALVSVLEGGGYSGSYILELETHNVAEHEREADVLRSYRLVRDILASAPPIPSAPDLAAHPDRPGR